MGEDEITVDFNGPLTMEQVEALEREANEVVYANGPIRITYPTSEELEKLEYRSKKELTGQVRIVEVCGADVCACCGPHVKQDGEIGLIKILGLINYKGGVRISMLCGRKAMLDYERKQKPTTAISVLLSAKPDRLTESVEKLKNDSQAKDAVINQLYQRLFQTLVQTRPDSEEWLFVKEDNLSPVQLRQYCTMLYEQKKGKVVLVCSGENEEWKYALGSAEADMRELSRRLNAALNGRGGGSNLMAQGTFHAAEGEIEKAWEEIAEAENGVDPTGVKIRSQWKCRGMRPHTPAFPSVYSVKISVINFAALVNIHISKIKLIFHHIHLIFKKHIIRFLGHQQIRTRFFVFNLVADIFIDILSIDISVISCGLNGLLNHSIQFFHNNPP